MRQQQSGFTLIEIVAVIVLLGILAVTAIPRFVNLQTDAKVAALKGVAAAVQGAYTQAYAKALIAGNVSSDNQTIDFGGTIGIIEIAFGYPEAVAETNGSIINMLNLDTAFATEGDTSGAVDIMQIGYDANNNGDLNDDNCFIVYQQSSAAGVEPQVIINAANIASC